MIPVSLTAKQLYSFESFRHDFSSANSGVITGIFGLNLDQNTANGAGKSTFLKLLYLAQFGHDMNGLPISEVINRGSEGGYIDFTVDDRGVKLRVVRNFGYKPTPEEKQKGIPNKDGISFFVEGKKFEDNEGKSDLKNEVIKRLKISPALYLASVMMAQKPKSTFLLANDTKKKELFAEVQEDIESYNGAFAQIKQDISKVEALLEQKRARLDSYIQSVEEKKSELAHLEKKNDAFEAEIKADIEAIEAERQALASEITRLEKQALTKKDPSPVEKAISELESKIQSLNVELAEEDEYQALRRTASDQVATLRSEKKTAVSELAKLRQSEACPTCNRAYDKGPDHEKTHTDQVAKKEAEIETLNKKIAKKEKILFDIDSALTVIGEKKRELRLVSESVRQKNASLSALKIENAKIDGLSAVIESKKQGLPAFDARIEDAKRRENPYTALIGQTKKKIEAYNEEIAKASDKIKEFDEELKYLYFWRNGFSPTGIVSFISDQLLALLNEKTKEYLDVLFDGALTIIFNSESITGKGVASNKISTDLYLNGKKSYFDSFSGGEQQREILAVELAFADVAESRTGTNINIKFLDEPFTGMDSAGQVKAMTLFRKIAAKKDGFYIITHDPNFQSLCDQGIYIVKQNEISRLVSKEEYNRLLQSERKA